MAKRVKLVSPNGEAEIEVNENDTEYLKSVGWKIAGSKPAKKTKEVANG
tara:strand:+ start:58 stop:204 length:147 start_codon:yes stop_codon:yes gene_type:complete